MIKLFALAIAVLPLAAHAADTTKAEPIPNATTVTVAVNLDCIVQADMTVKDCQVTNSGAVAETDAMDAIHAIEAKSTPVPSGKPGDKVHITMKLDHES